MSRVFHRPMFRMGGSAEGITSGLRRGFAFGSTGPQREYLEEKAKEEEVVEEAPQQTDLSFLEDYDIKPPEAPGFDWGTFGLNLMSGPSEGDIFSDIGTAGKEPWSRYKQGKAAYDMNKYKHNLAERQFNLEVYKAMNPKDRAALQEKIEYLMEAHGLSKEQALARALPEYRKPMNPEEKAWKDEQAKKSGLEAELQGLISGLGDKWTTLDLEDAKRIKAAKELAREKNLGFDLDASIIIDRRLWKGMNFGDAVQEDGSIGFHKDDWEKMDKTFQDGYVYVDIVSGNIYKKDGPKLIKIN